MSQTLFETDSHYDLSYRAIDVEDKELEKLLMVAGMYVGNADDLLSNAVSEAMTAAQQLELISLARKFAWNAITYLNCAENIRTNPDNARAYLEGRGVPF